MKFWIREMGWERGKRVIMNLLGVILNLVCDLSCYMAVNEKMLLPSFFLPRIFYCTSKNPYFCYFYGFLVVLWKMLKWIESDLEKRSKRRVYINMFIWLLTRQQIRISDFFFFLFFAYNRKKCDFSRFAWLVSWGNDFFDIKMISIIN